MAQEGSVASSASKVRAPQRSSSSTSPPPTSSSSPPPPLQGHNTPSTFVADSCTLTFLLDSSIIILRARAMVSLCAFPPLSPSKARATKHLNVLPSTPRARPEVSNLNETKLGASTTSPAAKHPEAAAAAKPNGWYHGVSLSPKVVNAGSMYIAMAKVSTLNKGDHTRNEHTVAERGGRT